MTLPTRLLIPQLTILAACAAAVGCGGSPWTPDPAPDMELVKSLQSGESSGGAADDSAAAPVGTGWGALNGRFVYEGQPPAPQALSITKDQAVCGGHNLVDESLVVGDDGGLANVVLFLRNKNPRVFPGYEESADTPAVLDNKNCRFTPHVLALRTSQPLEIKNSDSVGHNSNISPIGDAAANPLINANSSVEHQFGREQSVPVEVTCNIHPWMKGYVLPRSNPYFAVTDENGNFSIENLPAGEELEFQVWHERAPSGIDAVPGSSRGRFTITIPEDGEQTLDVKVPASALQ